MKNQLTTMGLLLGLTLSSAFAMAATPDAKAYILECGVSQTVPNANGGADSVPLAPVKYKKMTTGASMEIPFQVKNGTQAQDVVLHVETMVTNIPDFPEAGQVLTEGSMRFVLNFKSEGRSFSTLVSDRKAIPILEAGISFNLGSNDYGAGCTVTPKENYVIPEHAQEDKN
jgi:hypothetical protein